MKKIIQNFKNYASNIGVQISVFLTAINLIIFAIAISAQMNSFDKIENICVFSLFIEFFYGVVLSFNLLKHKEKFRHLIPFLYLNWFIGCFSINVFIPVFENLPIWVYLLTFIFCFTCFPIYNNKTNNGLSKLFYLVNGISFMLIIYFALYLFPLTPYALIGIIALGIGFYALVPSVVIFSHCISLISLFSDNKKNVFLFAWGIVAVMLSLTLFSIKLNAENEKISENLITKSFEENADLPNYITVSQNLKPNFFNEILLKRGLTYTDSDNFFQFRSFNDFGNLQFNERKTNNPFYNTAFMFVNKLDLSADDRISILKSNFDKRLETEEQLWSGEDLITKNIKEDIKIYPNNRLAYTEITMDIACKEKSWGQKEAIYSFQLPEGAVATSLSLWVNGVERKGVLTTKEKAKAAYKQIVAVENRDPSLMQWKEGNRVVVRVFPISFEMPRTFKCGFTTPLKLENNQLKYESLSIKGPNISGSKTLSRIQVVGNQKFESSKDFELQKGFFINNSVGLDAWNAIFPANKDCFSNAFVWKNKSYKINEIQKEIVPFSASEIVLDLNASWEIEEVKQLVNQDSKKHFVIFNNQKQEINSNNYETIFSQFEDLQYSLLPMYLLENNSLVVTKCGAISANFEELETTKYLTKLKANCSQKNIKVINISTQINPFWQTIKEQKYIEYAKTDLKFALDLISKNQFSTLKTAENKVNIEPANISIDENPVTKDEKSNGSNHIYRMYCFGKVLTEQVEIQKDSLNNKYINLAKDANIVTPISSLIVLETDADYAKNGIEKNENTLGNASIKNDGAVPEPHEWAMIVLLIGTLIFYYKKQFRYNF